MRPGSPHESPQGLKRERKYLMQRKILAICAALVALGALAIAPTMVSAATLKDTSGGVVTTLAAGAKITAYSTGTALFKGSGLTVECNENILTGTVDKNDGEEAQLTIEDAWFQSSINASGTKCKSSLGEATVTIPALTNEKGTGHWCIKNLKGTDNWELWGNSCTTATNTGTLTFVLDIGELQCKYTRTTEVGRNPEGNVVKGTFTTNVGVEHKAASLTLTNDKTSTGVDEEGVTFSKEEGGILCPSTGKLSGLVFDLFTDPETSNKYVSPTVAPNPVFITNP